MKPEQAEIHSNFWDETACSSNPFEPEACFCAGYDVYGDLLDKVSWIDYLFLLLKHEAPSPSQSGLLNALSVAIANPGPRDPCIQAAMSAGAGGSTSASSLMAAIAVGAGNTGGAREVATAMQGWQKCGQDLAKWTAYLKQFEDDSWQASLEKDVWLPSEHIPGFNPHGTECAPIVKQTLVYLSNLSDTIVLPWLQQNRLELEVLAASPLAMTGVVAGAFIDLGFEPAQAEMLFLLLRLPGAAAHALEQYELGWKNFPFFEQGLIVKGQG